MEEVAASHPNVQLVNDDKKVGSASQDQTKSDPTSSQVENPTSSTTSAVNANSNKITILLRAVGGAPILKERAIKVDIDRPLSSVIQNTKYRLRFRLEANQNLFFFVNQAFAPSPDQPIRNLYECFGTTDGKLILYYCTTVAWG